MRLKLVLSGLGVLLSLTLLMNLSNLNGVWAADKLKFATPVRTAAHLSLPALAAEDGGFWKEENLEIDWTPFAGGPLMIQALAAGAAPMGYIGPEEVIRAISKGIPLLIVADLKQPQDFMVWVLRDSPIRKPDDLKGTKVGTSQIGSMGHLHAIVFAKSLGLHEKFKFVAGGGVPQTIAALKARAIDALVLTAFTMAPMKIVGEAREVVLLAEYLPKEWTGLVLTAQKKFVENRPDVVRRVVRAVVKSTNFVMKNPQWSVEKMKSFLGYSDELARYVYGLLEYAKDGKINRKALVNHWNVLAENGIITKEEAPPVEQMYREGFTD